MNIKTFHPQNTECSAGETRMCRFAGMVMEARRKNQVIAPICRIYEEEESSRTPSLKLAPLSVVSTI